METGNSRTSSLPTRVQADGRSGVTVNPRLSIAWRTTAGVSGPTYTGVFLASQANDSSVK